MTCDGRCKTGMSVGMRKVYDWALDFQTKVDSKKFFNKSVQVVHEEGSIFILQHCMAIQVTLYPFEEAKYIPAEGQKWIVAISEHHPVLLWPEDEVLVMVYDRNYKMEEYSI